MSRGVSNGRSIILLAAALFGLLFMVDIYLRSKPEHGIADFMASIALITPSILENIIATIITFLALIFYFRQHYTFNFEKEKAPVKETGAELTTVEISDFVSTIDMSTVLSVYVVSITGDSTVKSLCNVLRRTGRKINRDNFRIEVLLRSDSSSDSKRIMNRKVAYDNLRVLQNAVNNLQFEVRHYSSVSPLRCVIMEHTDHKYSAFLSFYDWHESVSMSIRESATNNSIILRCVDCSNQFLSVYMSWFRHLWGNHKAHTLIFDFDDTLFKTTHAQVTGWVKAIMKCVNANIIQKSELNGEIASVVNDEVALTKKMTEVFLDEQQENKIINRIFSSPPGASNLDIMKAERIKIREEETIMHAVQIVEIAGQVRDLSREYQLVIVSATSERVINEVLKSNSLDGVFSYVFGKEASHNWYNVEGKTPTFIRVSNMIGVPLDRMIFVGDSDADYRSAKQLGLWFVECRINAKDHGRKTLVKSRAPDEDEYIVGSGKNQGLLAVISRIEGQMQQLNL